MPLNIPTMASLYSAAVEEIQRRNPGLTNFRPGGNLDALAGAGSVLASETVAVALRVYRDRLVSSASEEAVLEIAQGRYGWSPLPPTKAAGYVLYTGTVPHIVRTTDTFEITAPGGDVVVFRPVSDVENPTAGSAISIEADLEGPSGNIPAGRPVSVNVDEDPDATAVLVAGTRGGDNEESVEHLRRRLFRMPKAMGGGTRQAIQVAALSTRHRRVEYATLSVATTNAGSILTLAVADASGAGNAIMVEDVEEALVRVTSAGAWLEVVPAVRQEVPLAVEVRLRRRSAASGTFIDKERVRTAIREAVLDVSNGVGPNETWSSSSVKAAAHNALPPDVARSAVVTVRSSGNVFEEIVPLKNRTLRLLEASLDVEVRE